MYAEEHSISKPLLRVSIATQRHRCFCASVRFRSAGTSEPEFLRAIKLSADEFYWRLIIVEKDECESQHEVEVVSTVIYSERKGCGGVFVACWIQTRAYDERILMNGSTPEYNFKDVHQHYVRM